VRAVITLIKTQMCWAGTAVYATGRALNFATLFCSPPPMKIQLLYIHCSGVCGYKLSNTTGSAPTFLHKDNSTGKKGLGQLDHAHGDRYVRKVHTHLHMQTVNSTRIITRTYVNPMEINIFTHYLV